MTSKIKTKRERVKFASDNVAGACPEVLDAIIKANEGDSIPYGNDEWSTNLQNKFSEIFEKDVIVYPTASGTAANALALSAMTPVFGSIIGRHNGLKICAFWECQFESGQGYHNF